MTLAQRGQSELDAAREYFHRSTRGLSEALSTFAPASGMRTVAQQVAHAAQTIEWFADGAFRPGGFDLDFERMERDVTACTSLAAAREWFDRATEAAKRAFADRSDKELLAPLPPGPIMAGEPRFAVIGALTDHTAHHRGALTVYARLNGIVPPMPYMEP